MRSLRAGTSLRLSAGSLLGLGVLAGLLLPASPPRTEKLEVAARMDAAFAPLPRHAAEPTEPLKRGALARRAPQRGGAMAALAYREFEPVPGVFRPRAPLNAAAVSPRQAPTPRAIELARLPRARPEPPIITGSIGPSGGGLQSEAESDFLGRFAGSFSGSGEVKRDAQANANQVRCTLAGRPTAFGVSISGKCGAFVFSREVRADIRYDPASGVYTGTYVGSAIGPAKLFGRRRGDHIVLTITWPKPVNGDTKATMTIHNPGDGTLAIIVTDEIRPGGPTAEVTRLALSQT